MLGINEFLTILALLRNFGYWFSMKVGHEALDSLGMSGLKKRGQFLFLFF